MLIELTEHKKHMKEHKKEKKQLTSRVDGFAADHQRTSAACHYIIRRLELFRKRHIYFRTHD